MCLLLDEPTNHLDLESLTALNNGLIAFPEVLLFASHDHQLVSTVANRIVEITPDGIIDRMMGYDEYLENTNGEVMKRALCRCGLAKSGTDIQSRIQMHKEMISLVNGCSGMIGGEHHADGSGFLMPVTCCTRMADGRSGRKHECIDQEDGKHSEGRSNGTE